MILPDNETKDDLLNNDPLAKTIVKLLRMRPDHPITIGVHGDWGAGKSSVLEMIEAALSAEKNVLCLKINGWRFQGFEDAKIALIEAIVTGLIEKRPALNKAIGVVKETFRRLDWLKVAKKAGGLAVTAYTGIPALGFETLVDKVEDWFADPQKLLDKEKLNEAATEAKDFLKEKGESRNVPEEIAAFRKAFDGLLKEAGIEQLVVLIDDLDRCLPDTAIDILEAVRLFVFTSRTAFVVAADEAMIEYAVRKHFPDLPDTTGPQTYARNYLEKLIQVPFRIPALGETETLIFITLLLIGARLGEDDEAFTKLIAAAREKLKKPWVSNALDITIVREALGEKVDQIQQELTISAQIGPILTSGAKGNPRQIKRFLNTLLLRQSSAEARGFAEDVKLPVLAKLMLAERFLPRLYDQIAMTAASAPSGVCTDLTILEETFTRESGVEIKAVKEPIETKSESRSNSQKKSVMVKPQESAQLREWRSSQAIMSWAQVFPPIGAMDLRPYLFVAKDRKDYFGATSVLGHLAGVVEKLLGPKFTVVAMEQELAQLAAPEAVQVFEAVRGRIVGSDVFDTTPDGAAGITVLVKAHPSLQENLLDFLGSLPANRLGPWICSGWEGVIKEAAMSRRFELLLEGWSKDGSPALKATASTIMRTRKQGANR